MQLRTWTAVLAAGLCIGVCVTAAAADTGMAAAATYTTEDGILTMAFPTADWVVEDDSLSWFTLTNGKDFITGDHYAAGESSLDAVLTDDSSGYGAVYQTVLVTENELFVLRGYAAEKGADLEELQQIIGSARVLRYDTITAVLQEEEEEPETPAAAAKEEEFRAKGTITARSLNVRSSAAAEAPALGELVMGDTVDILGKVTESGTGAEWLKITYNGETAYVFAGYVTLAEAEEEIPVEEAEHFEEIALYGVNGDVVKVTRLEGDSGVWSDAKGITYEWSGRNPEVMVDDNGDYWATSNSYWEEEDLEIDPEEEKKDETSVEEHVEEEEPVTEVRLEGTSRNVTVYRNGDSFYDVNGMEYWFVGSRMWKNENDEMFYEP